MTITLTRLNGETIWTGDAASVLEAVEQNKADLHRADLHGANLSGATLHGADLHRANLHRANLKNTFLGPPTMMLMADWGAVSDELTTLLMAYDAANHPTGRESFSAWAAGGECPYSGQYISRVANFREQRSLWNPDAPLLSAYELMVRLIREQCADSDFHTEAR